MGLGERIRSWLHPAAYLAHNRITLAGAVVTTSSAVTILLFFGFDLLFGANVHPYSGIMLFLILPAIFLVGLLLIPAGMLWQRRRRGPRASTTQQNVQLDFTKAVVRQTFGWIAGLTIVNILILGIASYRGVEYMDSSKFCGQTCHTVMEPEFTTYENSPHQRVGCVQCHIGPGASWFVRSKLSGVRQVVAVTFHTYDRPIPSPVEQLRPARETCEQCHWPQMFTGDRFVVRTHYGEDEKNTPKKTILILKIGGSGAHGGVGIHGRHLDLASPIRYVPQDRQRQVIPVVFYGEGAGKQIQFASGDAKAVQQQVASGDPRTMDCIDCHNRPTHVFQLPEEAVDLALSQKSISADLPFIKKVGVEALKGNYAGQEAAAQGIAARINEFYRASYPELYRGQSALIDAAIRELQLIYARNVFPKMKVSWGTYPNNLGHTDFPGCFRCHDGSHTSADGQTIPNDCDTCHTLLAVDETDPKVLAELGMK
jgi:nitrate/TMAO reductase-like tetraheme cytochrome c subunit